MDMRGIGLSTNGTVVHSIQLSSTAELPNSLLIQISDQQSNEVFPVHIPAQFRDRAVVVPLSRNFVQPTLTVLSRDGTEVLLPPNLLLICQK